MPVLNRRSSSPRSPTPAVNLGDVDSGERIGSDVRRSVDAPVKLVIFSDYQCPYCAAWSQDTLPKMLDYVDRICASNGARSMCSAPRPNRRRRPPMPRPCRTSTGNSTTPCSQTASPLPDELTPEALTAVAEQIRTRHRTIHRGHELRRNRRGGRGQRRHGHRPRCVLHPTFILDGQPYVGAQPTDVFVDAVETAKKGQN